MAAGVIFTLMFMSGRIPVSTASLVAFGAIAGFLIGLPFSLVEHLVTPITGRTPARFRLAVRIVAYLIAAFIGFGIAFPIAGLIVYKKAILLPLGLPITFATVGAAILGLAVYGYQTTRARLEASLTRIKEQEFAEKELELARAIQQRLLPPPESSGPGFLLVARNIPARWVAGDFYDLFHYPDGALGIAIADVAGKGIGASLIMSTAKAMLPLLAADRTVEETLRELNHRLGLTLGKREFVALALARFNPSTGLLQISNAGLPNPYVLSLGGAPQEVDTPGPRVPLGVMKNVAYKSLTLQLEPGDRLLLYTDGLPEAPTHGGEPIGYVELERIISASVAKPVGEWIDELITSIQASTPDGLDDDCTVMVLERVQVE